MLNYPALQKLTSDEFEQRLLAWCKKYAPDFVELGDKFKLFASANHERSKTFRDAIVTSQFLIVDDNAITWPETKPVRKALLKGDVPGVSRMPAILEALESLEEWNVDSIDACLHSLAETLSGGSLGKIAQPVRIAVAGGPVSPSIGDTLVLLGKESSIIRMRRCYEYFASNCEA